jgi:hydroxypyruvate isomerase
MPKFAANLSFLFTELPLLERFEAAARSGFTAVELPYPYQQNCAIAHALDACGLVQAVMNTPKRDEAPGTHGLACVPGQEAEFRRSIEEAANCARKLRCRSVHVLAGLRPSSRRSSTVYKTFVENIAFAAEALGREGIQALIEPINPRDLPGYFLDHPETAWRAIHDAGVSNLFLQYDLYHAQITQGDLARSIERYLPRIAHVQVADPPDRSEPGTGEVNFSFLFELLDRLGYDGWIGCEYRPKAHTEAGLVWLAPYLR